MPGFFPELGFLELKKQHPEYRGTEMSLVITRSKQDCYDAVVSLCSTGSKKLYAAVYPINANGYCYAVFDDGSDNWPYLIEWKSDWQHKLIGGTLLSFSEQLLLFIF